MRRIILIGLVAVLLLVPASMAAGCGQSAKCCGGRISCQNHQTGDCTPANMGLVPVSALSPARVSYTVPLSVTGQNNCLRLIYPSSADLSCFAVSDAASGCYRM